MSVTVASLVDNFRLLYDIGALALPGFEDDEIKRLLNIEQYKLINQKIGGNNIYGQKFPDTEKRIDDIRGLLIEAAPLSLSKTYNDNEYLVSISSLNNYFHLYEVRIKGTIGSSTIYLKAEPIAPKVLDRFSSGFRNSNPTLRSPKYMVSTDTSGFKILRVFCPSDITISEYEDCIITYIKNPADLTSLETVYDFNNDVYLELVRSTVDTAISIVSPNKSQISQQQLNKTE